MADLGTVVGSRRVLVCSNMAFSGDFTPVLAKHSKSFSLLDAISVGVDRMQRNFEPMRKQVEVWRQSELPNVNAKIIIYQAFIGANWTCPNTLHAGFTSCTFGRRLRISNRGPCGALSNAFTSAFKELDPIPQFKATAKLGSFLDSRFKQSF